MGFTQGSGMPGVLSYISQLGCAGEGGLWGESRGRWVSGSVPRGVSHIWPCDPHGWGGESPVLWAAGCPRAAGEQVTAAWAGGLPWLLGLGSQPPPLPPVLLLTPE